MTMQEHSWTRRLSRRTLLRTGGAAALVVTSITGCDLLSADPDDPPPGDAAQEPGNEAPALAALVERGELPPLEERLPETPLIVEPVEQIGRYGGTWRTVTTGSGPRPLTDLSRTFAYENLVRWAPDARNFSPDDVIPNLAEEFEVSPDGTEFTFRLRAGIRWSDGERFTVDDIVFAYEDVHFNKEINPVTSSLWLSEESGTPATLEKVDDQTIRFVFAEPKGLFLLQLASANGGGLTIYPAHYMKEFHAQYNDLAQKLAEEAGLESWVDLFQRESGESAGVANSEKPVLFAWQLTQDLGTSTTRIVAGRNPYYWKVDPEGNQLPYLDNVSFEIIEDREVITLRAAAGEFDLEFTYINVLQNKPVLARDRDSGDYRFIDIASSLMNTMMIGLNLTHQDAGLREVFNNRDFRIGLSHAINRPEIVETVYQRQGEPWQGAPRPESAYYNERLAKQYTEYDLELANQHLDLALPDKDDQGHRLAPDGNPFSFQVDVPTGHARSGAWADAMELVRGYWNAVGVEMQINSVSLGLANERRDSNSQAARVHQGDGGLDLPLIFRWYAPTDQWWAFGWNRWFDNPDDESAVEPPPAAKEQIDLIGQFELTVDPDSQKELVNEILAIAQEQFWVIGINLETVGFGITRNNFHNVPEEILDSFYAPSLAITNPEQYFLTEP